MTCDTTKLREIFDRGLSHGLGRLDSSMCIEAAIAISCGEGFSDRPKCVHTVDRGFAVQINDAKWSSPQARAEALWPLALAQLDTAGKDRSKWVENLVKGIDENVYNPLMVEVAKTHTELSECVKSKRVLLDTLDRLYSVDRKPIHKCLRKIVSSRLYVDSRLYIDARREYDKYNGLGYGLGILVDHMVSLAVQVNNNPDTILKAAVQAALEAYKNDV